MGPDAWDAVVLGALWCEGCPLLMWGCGVGDMSGHGLTCARGAVHLGPCGVGPVPVHLVAGQGSVPVWWGSLGSPDFLL